MITFIIWFNSAILYHTSTLATLTAILIKIVCLLIAIAFYTLAERKIMAAVQRRRGPNVVGFWGLLQSLADGLKLLIKEMLIPTSANSNIFVISPLIILALSLLAWSVIPFAAVDLSMILSEKTALSFCQNTDASLYWTLQNSGVFNTRNYVLTWPTQIAYTNYGILVVLAISSLNVYSIIIAGWSSNSKYAFLGALRSAAQMISYEVSISICILPVIVLAGTLNFAHLVLAQAVTGWFIFPLLPASFIFFISMLAETNRAPFDLPEAEAELVAGYNVEYSSIIFAMFFLAEYSNMILMSALFSLLFLGGWFPIFAGSLAIPMSLVFAVKTGLVCFSFVLVRATFPRYRYDQLMDIGWKVFLPFTLGYLVFVVGLLVAFESAPQISEWDLNTYSDYWIHTKYKDDTLSS